MELRFFDFNTDKFCDSVKRFENLLARFGNPVFENASIEYYVHSHNKDYPLVFRAANLKIAVSGVATGIRSIKTDATIELLEVAGFKPGDALENALRTEEDLNITIHYR